MIQKNNVILFLYVNLQVDFLLLTRAKYIYVPTFSHDRGVWDLSGEKHRQILNSCQISQYLCSTGTVYSLAGKNMYNLRLTSTL